MNRSNKSSHLKSLFECDNSSNLLWKLFLIWIAKSHILYYNIYALVQDISIVLCTILSDAAPDVNRQLLHWDSHTSLSLNNSSQCVRNPKIVDQISNVFIGTYYSLNACINVSEWLLSNPRIHKVRIELNIYVILNQPITLTLLIPSQFIG